MKKLLEIGNRYVETSDWKIITVLKFCLLALGMLFGISVGEKQKKPVRIAAAGIFLASYIPLMAKLADAVREVCQDTGTSEPDEGEPEPEEELSDPEDEE